MAWPKVSEPIVPAGFVQAIALFTEATTPQELARAVGEQLARAVPGFQEAQQAFARETPYAEQERLGALERQVVEPLKRLNPPAEVRLVLDGLDRVATGALGSVMAAIEELAELDFMRLLITARPDTALPKAASIYPLPRAADEDVIQYLERRGIPDTRREEVADAAQGNWLVARVLADLLRERGDVEIRAAGQLALGDAYEELLLRCGAASDNAAQRVLEVLAAAGAGPLLPLSILCAASKALDGPDTPAGVRDHLVRLRGLAVRSAAGTEREHAGLFHDTLVQHIAAHAPDRNRPAHRAIIAGIEALAPIAAGPAELSDPEQRYAFEREAEHLWALGETESALESLSARTSPVPRDNLRRWRPWLSRVEETFGPDHPDTLTTRGNIAFWTGQCGDNREALRLFQALLPDHERVLGPDHPDTLTTRSNIAAWTGECGDAREALRLFQALLPDRSGCSAPITRIRSGPAATSPLDRRVRGCRGGAAALPGAASRPRAGARPRSPGYAHDPRQHRRLDRPVRGRRGGAAALPGAASRPERVLGPDHPDTLRTRNNIASWTGECGDAGEALRLFQALLPDHERVLGPDHPDTLMTRSNIAFWTGECGDAGEALRLFQALLPDRERVLGPDHPDTLRPAATSPPGPASAGTTGRRCGSSRRCFPTRSECSAPITRIRSGPAATSPPGPASAGTPGRRCGCSRRCFPTRSECSAPITRIRSRPGNGLTS